VSDVINTSARSNRPRRYGRVGKTLDELDDRLGVARGGRTFMDKIFPTTGLSCSARSRSTRS